MSKMKLHAIFLQRKEHYQKQHAPELYAALDEYTCEGNSEIFEDHCFGETSR